MKPDFPALCFEMYKELVELQVLCGDSFNDDYFDKLCGLIDRADAISPHGGHAWHGWALREAFLAGCSHSTAELFETDKSQLSDGYHTFQELYEHRHALCLALMKAMPQHWWFSTRHSDGELCFGSEDWFIIGAELPGLGEGSSITYHLPSKLLEAARATGASELPVGRPWDGHTANDVVERFLQWVCLPQV